jgi:hypothetical protein
MRYQLLAVLVQSALADSKPTKVVHPSGWIIFLRGNLKLKFFRDAREFAQLDISQILWFTLGSGDATKRRKNETYREK